MKEKDNHLLDSESVNIQSIRQVADSITYTLDVRQWI